MDFFRCCKMCVPPERHSGCHAGCSKHIDAKKAFNAQQDRIKQEDKARRDADSVLHRKSCRRR